MGTQVTTGAGISRAIAAFFLAASAAAQPVPPNVTLWSPQPGNDSAPVFSPDGKWIVFVSEIDGDTDLRILRSDRPPVDSPEPLFPSAAEDDQPAFSPDGKWLAWRSTREDVFGDIWVMRFPQGEPFSVSVRGSIDREPHWYRATDGMRLRWTAADHEDNVRFFSVRAGSWDTVTEEAPGSDDEMPRSLFLQWEDDTNGDGEASARSGDNPSVWLRPSGEGTWRQLTPPLPGLNSPVFHDGRLVLSARFRDDLDIAVVDEPFEVAAVADASSALEAARRARALRPLRPFEAVALGRQGFLLEPDTGPGLECALLAIEVLREAGRPEQALRMVRNVERVASTTDVVRLEIERFALEPVVSRRRDVTGDELDVIRGKSIERLRAVSARTDLAVELRASALQEAAFLETERENISAALLILNEALALDGIDGDSADEIRLQSARLTTQLDPDQAAAVYDRLLQRAKSKNVLEDAALERIAIVRTEVADLDTRVISVRRVAAASPDNLVLQAAASLEEGRVFAAAARTRESREAFRAAAELTDDAPRIAALASFDLARSFAAEGRYIDSVRVYREVAERLRNSYFDAAPRFVVEAQEGFVREFLARGNEELRLGDPQLASATFRELIDEEPGLVEAWRGYLEAEFRAGRLDDDVIAVYRRDARRKKDDSLAWYLSGLAQTYRDAASKGAAEDIRRAIALDGTVPYYHQTLGFIHEAVARRTGSRQEIAAAWDRYQRALSLLDVTARPRDYARLLINAGNAAFGLGLHPRAAELYQRRLDQAVPFDDPRTEFLMARQHAIALFRSFRASAAASRFDDARELLPTLRRQDLIDDTTVHDIETELLDRRALALLDAGRFEESAAEFAIVGERNPAGSLNRARALRNRGIALSRLAAEEGSEFEETRLAAMKSLTQALVLIEDRNLEVPEPGEPGGLLGFSFGISSDQFGGAALNLSPEDERRLVLAALARLETLGGDHDRAIERIQAQLDASPEGREGTEAYHNTVKLVALDQLASQQRLAGRPREAVGTLLTALDRTRVETEEEPVINGAGLVNILMQLTELALAADETPFTPEALQETWLKPEGNNGDPLRLLDSMLLKALSRRDSAGFYVIADSERRIRLTLSRALLAERLSIDAAGSLNSLDDLASGLNAHRAELLANEVIRQADGIDSTAGTRRLGVLAHGLLLRTGARLAPETMVDRRARAIDFAGNVGRDDLRWWLKAQESLTAGIELARAAAYEALNEIERLPPSFWNDDASIPWSLIDYCRRLTIDSAFETEEPWLRAFDVVQRWQAAEQRLASSTATPLAARDETENAWLGEAMQLLDGARAATETLRTSMPGTSRVTAREGYDALAERWERHVQDGLDGGLLIARYFSPSVHEIENPAAALAELAVLPSEPAVVLNTHHGAGAWTETGFQELNGTNREVLAASYPVWFVFGDPLSTGPAAETIVNVLSLDLTALAMSSPTLDTGGDVLLWPDDNPGRDLPRDTDKLQLTSRLHVRGSSPGNWQVGSTGKPLGRVFNSALPDAMLIATTRNADEHARRLVATACAAAGVTDVRIDNRVWSSTLFAPSLMPEAAQDALDAAVGTIQAQLSSDDTLVDAIPTARRIAFLRGALDRPVGEIAEAQLLVAQTLGDLGQYAEASAAAAEVADLWRADGNDAELARALRIRGSYCNDARQFADSVAAYEEAKELYLKLGLSEDAALMHERLGVAYENSGQIRDALAVYHDLLKATAGDSLNEARQLRRIGRLYLHRFIDYPQAEESFRAAAAKAEEAGNESLLIESTLDIARCRERLGDYEEAMRLAGEMKNRAVENADDYLECDALLLECFIHWARAEYLDAFNAQRAALRIVEETGDRPFAIIAHNYAGLIYWSLNDTERALQEYDTALVVAGEGLFEQELASTLNNRALVHRSREEFGKALSDLEEALRIDRETGNRWGQAYALRNIGITLTQQGRFEEALDPLSRAVNIAGAIGDRVNRVKAVAATADALRELGRDSEAGEYYLDALSEGSDIPLPEVQWRALYGRALLELKHGRRGSARELLGEAIDIVESLRAAIRIEEFQDGFLLDKQDLYDEMIALLLDDEETVRAFEYSERSRGRHFIDLLGNRRLDFASTTDEEALSRENELRTRIETLERGVSSADGEELQLARQAYSDFLVELRAANPQLSSFVEVQPVTLDEVQSLLDEGTRLLSWHVMERELAVWIIASDHVDIVRLPVTRSELASRIAAFRVRLQNFERVGNESGILSSWLAEPLLPFLAETERLGMIPHRELHLMPFAALRTGEGYLNDRFALFHAPSTSVLRYTFGRRTAERGEGILAIGNPDYGDEALDLPFAEKEAERLALTFPGATLLTGEEATETWIADNIGRYAVVHIATHGEYDPNLPLMSAIRLTADSANDGELTADEVFGLSINADLVALSACQTGLGRLSNGDDIVGLNRSFVYAGTRQILSTLWRVDDVSTAVLIKHFYRNLRDDSMDRAEALRRAQLEVRKRYPHPAHWSGMVLSGDWQ